MHEPAPTPASDEMGLTDRTLIELVELRRDHAGLKDELEETNDRLAAVEAAIDRMGENLVATLTSELRLLTAAVRDSFAAKLGDALVTALGEACAALAANRYAVVSASLVLGLPALALVIYALWLLQGSNLYIEVPGWLVVGGAGAPGVPP